MNSFEKPGAGQSSCEPIFGALQKFAAIQLQHCSETIVGCLSIVKQDVTTENNAI